MDGVVLGEACMTNAASNLQLTTRAWPKTQREQIWARGKKLFAVVTYDKSRLRALL